MIKVTKVEVHQGCILSLQDQLTYCKGELSKLKESAEGETKSSMGDKYETGRAMISQESEKHNKRISEIHEQLRILNLIRPEVKANRVGLGSLVEANTGWYYISTSIGKVSISGVDVYVISGSAPLAKEMLGKKTGDDFKLNDTIHHVIQVM